MDNYKDEIILQPRSITMGCSSLNLTEFRILKQALFVLRDAQREHQNSLMIQADLFSPTLAKRTLSFKMNEVIKKNIAHYRNAIEKLVSLSYGFLNDDGTYVVRNIFSEASYQKGNICLEINEKAYPYLVDLSKGYTKLNLKFALYDVKSLIALRWYDIFTQSLHLNAGKKASVQFGLKEIRALFALSDKYNRQYDFIRWVIKNPIVEINDSSDIQVEYKINKVKGGSPIICFTITNKKSSTVKSNSKKMSAGTHHLIWSNVFDQYNLRIDYFNKAMLNNSKVVYKNEMARQSAVNKYYITCLTNEFDDLKGSDIKNKFIQIRDVINSQLLLG